MKRSINDYDGNIPDTSSVKLSEPIAIIGELAKKMTDKTTPYFPKDGTSKSEKLVLQCLMNTNGVTQLDIVKFTGLKPPTISIMIQKMEKQGLVTRVTDKFDLRAMRVYITEKGIEVYKEDVLILKTVEGKLLKGLETDELNTMVAAMKKIRDNLEDF
ncbi:MAG: MarR family transcriptional regulator [Clostridia bacterium]|nr:MarR family transcriptional regulator [Clostridia bacterium]